MVTQLATGPLGLDPDSLAPACVLLTLQPASRPPHPSPTTTACQP